LRDGSSSEISKETKARKKETSNYLFILKHRVKDADGHIQLEVLLRREYDLLANAFFLNR